MARDSQYTDKILEYIKSEERPVTASEIEEAVGMSRQGAYQWVEAQAWRLREVGTGRNNARAYVLREDADRLAPNFRPSGAWQVKPRSQRNRPAGVSGSTPATVADLTVGTILVVSATRLVDGRVEVELQTESGASVSVTLDTAQAEMSNAR